MSNIIRIPNNWNPRAHQRKLWDYLEGGGKRAVEVAHRRWGKDDVALHWTASSAHEIIGNYWHMLPLANQARKAIWDAVNPHTGLRRIDEAFPHALRETTRESDMFIRFKCGSSWQVLGSDNYLAQIGSPPVGVVFSEWSLADPEVWSQLRPILRENGGWALFIYTPKGKNHGWTTLKFAESEPGWYADVQPASETGMFTEQALAEELREYISEYGEDDGRAYFDQEYNCSFNAPLLGSYYGSYLGKARAEGRIGSVPYEPGLPVYTGWDLGRSDDTAIWFAQRQGVNVRVIDYYKSTGKTIDQDAKALQNKPYVYGKHILPHDGSNVLKHAPDSLAAQLDKFFPNLVTVLPNDDIEKGVQAVRRLLPVCYFDEAKCSEMGGIATLESYHREWDDKRKMFKDVPCHDWASHGADAFRSLALGIPQSLQYVPPKEPGHLIIGGKSTMTMDQLWAHHDRSRRAGRGRI
jgi:phage terminase large subunit